METSLDARFRCCWRVVVAVLLLRFSYGVPTALARIQSDFLNIDCGATETSVDGLTNFTWVRDDDYISTGETHTFTTAGTDENLLNYKELKTLRYFDDLRPKNCFTLPVVSGNYYLLRMTYFYGNYDNKNQPPSFQVALDATVMENITSDSTGSLYSEYSYVAKGNVTYLCLLRTSPLHSPLISGISLKLANEMTTYYADDYAQFLQHGIVMRTVNRVNFGAAEMIRAPDDYYDRFWFAEGLDSLYLKRTLSPMQNLSTNSTILRYVDSASGPPSAVLQTGITTSDTITSLLLPPGYDGIVTAWYVAVNFAELNSTGSPTRNFTLQVHNYKTNVSMDGSFLNLKGYEIWSTRDSIIGPDSTMTLTPLADSMAGPILNSMEFFKKSGPQLDKTTDRDVLAIEDIKKNMKLMEWSGDPCLPVPHSWITCSADSQPQIIAVNLSGYRLESTIPASFASLIGLTTLILDNNNFSGPLPAWLATLTNLNTLSIRNNNFSGPVPDALLSADSLIEFEYRPGNLLLTGTGGNLLGSPCDNCQGKSSSAAIVGAVIGGVAGLIFIIAIAIVAYYRYQLQHKVPNQSDDEGTSMMKISTMGGAKAYSLADVKVATSNFNKELGRGGFGSVYYGKFLDGQEVAVKVADGSSKRGEKEFFNEVDVLSRVHHKNLVALLGYCQGQKPILIYEYMHNGSLFDHLHGTSARVSKLDWKTRLRIALNAAQGLAYLHTGCSPSFIHRDVKSNNILLTSKLDAKVADFGLTKLMGEAEDTRVITDVMGTAGYLDPEYYITQYLSSKSDVYSFGIVLLELITGHLPIDQSTTTMERNPNIVHWVQESLQNGDIDSILDPTLKGSNPSIEAIWKVVDIAMQSVEPKGVDRPTMMDVVQELQGAMTIEGIRMSPFRQTQLHSNFSSNSSNFQYGSINFPKPV